jgi:flagellar motor switch/type III secretory pathway protein FliN
MAAMNRSEMGADDANLGANLNLDDDSLFAELDSEVMVGEEPAGGGDFDFDLDLGGDAAPAAEASDDLDLDLGGAGLPAPGEAGDLDLDLDLGGDMAAAGTADDLDLDLGAAAGSGAGMDDLDLDLGAAPAPAGKAGSVMADAGVSADEFGDLDLDLDAEPAMDLDLSPPELAPEESGMDLDLGAPAAPMGDADMDLDLDLDASPELAETPAESESMAAGELGDMDLELGAIAPEAEESAMPALGGDELEALDLSLDEPVLQPAPDMDAAPAFTDDDLGLDALSVEPMDLSEEPVFDMAAVSAPAEAESEFHAAEDVPLDDEGVQLELQDVDMQPIEDESLLVDDMIALEPGMRADNAVDLGPMAGTAAAMAAGTASEFVAVPDTNVEDEDLLELNQDDLDAPAQEAPMMQAQSQAAPKRPPALGTAIPAADLLEIPPEIPAMEPLEMEPLDLEPLADFDMMEDMSASLMPEPMPAVQPAPRPMPAMQPAPASQAPAAAAGSLLGNDILLAVSHQISVQLGSLNLNGKELLGISYGSVLPLERVIGEPVDLVLENKTIAQAEVVLINGKNLGVRIVALNR